MENENLKQALNIFIEEKIQDNYKNIISNSNNKEIIDNQYFLFRELEKKTKNFKLLEKYKEAEIDSYTIQLQEAYKLGFNDCINILN